MEDETYRYDGPETYHSLVGQVMASLGYVGGREPRHVGAEIVVKERPDGLYLSCRYGLDGKKEASFDGHIPADGRERAAVKDCLLHWYRTYSGSNPSPWGTLVGVRPVKLVHRLFAQGCQEQEVRNTLQSAYEVNPELARELTQIALRQMPYMKGSRRDVSVYIGIPYCPSHCLYCSFPSRLVGQEEPAVLEQFVSAVERDIDDLRLLCDQYGLQVHTVYIGGGTPTCLPVPLLRRLLAAVAQAFLPVAEWTVEAGRPDTASAEVLALMKQFGVSRISVNPQTMQQRLLDAIGRSHTVEDIYAMYERCRKLAFPVVNMDFIAGLPGQQTEDMRENMKIVCQQHPENVTIHTLALKKRAPLFGHALRRAIPCADEVAQMLEICRNTLATGGYEPYYLYRQTYMAASFANVGYALPGAISPYNIEMMEERQTVLAAGPGGATKYVCADGHHLEKLYMPKDVARYREALPEMMKRRRRLCAVVYGGEDL